ncbi:MAG: hypothetical protein V5786_10325 [Psychromonas sp.]
MTVRFKATKAGTFVYHCTPGGAMIPWHVVSGMNGAITILPKDGDGNSITYDKAFYIGGQDFYLPKDDKGNYKRYPSPLVGMADTLVVMKTLLPSHLPFNGVMNAMTGANAFKGKVGETGSFSDAPNTNLETWAIVAGAALYTFKQPGTYAYVSHNLIEAILMGIAYSSNR